MKPFFSAYWHPARPGSVLVLTLYGYDSECHCDCDCEINSTFAGVTKLRQRERCVCVVVVLTLTHGYNAVRGHRTGSNNSGAEDYLRRKHNKKHKKIQIRAA